MIIKISDLSVIL